MKSDIFPSFQDSKILSLTEVYIDEFYLWKEFQKIATLYPTAQFHNILPFKHWRVFEGETPSTAYPQFSKVRGENQLRLNVSTAIKHTLRTNKLPIRNLMEKNQGFIQLYPSHFLSGFRWQKNSNKSKNTKLLVIDAHDDRGGVAIDSLWLQPHMLAQTGFIGGWGMACTDGEEWINHEKQEIADNYGFFAETIDNAIQSDFRKFFRNSQVLISIDLDYFDHGPYLSSYWFKNLFLTHSLSVRQKIELLLAQGKLKGTKEIDIGEIALGSKLLEIHSSIRQRIPIYDSIFSMFCEGMTKVLHCFIEENVTIIGIDLCEYSPILDKNAETFQLIIKMANFLNNHLEKEFLNR